MGEFEKLLMGGHPNSLGKTVEVVETVLKNPERFEELFSCYFSNDEVVRLRVSNAMKRICAERKNLLIPYLNRFLTDVAHIGQASTQWTLAQLFLILEKDMSDSQIRKAKEILTKNLAEQDDWIVLNMTMQTLGEWSEKDSKLRFWLLPHLERLSLDSRKSVSRRAKTLLAKFT